MAKRWKCGACKRPDGTHTDGCPRRVCKFCARVAPDKCKWHGGRSHGNADKQRRSKSGKLTPTRTTAGKAPAAPDLPTNGARETARTLLGQLEALRAKLDARITAVRELTEIL